MNNEDAFDNAIVSLLDLIGRLADSDDKRLSIRCVTHDMQNIQIELGSSSDVGAGGCAVYFMEYDGAVMRLSTQGADPADDYRSFSIAADAITPTVSNAIAKLLPKIILRAGRDTTRNLNVTLKMFEEAT